MNIVRNMEAIIVITLGLIMATGVANATVPKHHAAHSSVISVDDGKVAVVTVSAKRMTAAEKLAAQ